jgi:hypothetical protein
MEYKTYATNKIYSLSEKELQALNYFKTIDKTTKLMF